MQRLSVSAPGNGGGAVDAGTLAQAQAQRIQNEGTRLAVVRTQIDYVCDKLKLNPDNPEKREQIEELCLSTVKYLEQNPVGSIDGVWYDITKEVEMLKGNGETKNEVGLYSYGSLIWR